MLQLGNTQFQHTENSPHVLKVFKILSSAFFQKDSRTQPLNKLSAKDSQENQNKLNTYPLSKLLPHFQ